MTHQNRAANLPVEPVGRHGQPQPVATVERTGKRWKQMQVWAFVLLVIGVFLFVSGMNKPESRGATEAVVAVILWSVALALYFVARVGAWWHHR